MNTKVQRVFIADDEPPARARLAELLEDLQSDYPTELVGEAGNGQQVIERLPASGATVLFLDIQMPGLSGLEVARHLQSLTSSPAIVFVTAHDAHAVEAFELNALDYLLKPVRAVRLAAALARSASIGAPKRDSLERAHAGARSHLSVVERNRILLVPVEEIIYFKAELKYVTVRTRNREVVIEESLVSLEREFAGAFLRIHRNCIVARAAIRAFERALTGDGEEESHWEVVLTGVPERLPVSRRQWPVVRDFAGES